MRRVHELMTRGPIVAVHPTAPISAVIRLMAERGVSHVVVLEQGELVGLACICDLEDSELQAAVSLHMSRNPVTVEDGASAFEAARCMLERGISCLPVMHASDLVGIVTLSDLRRERILEQMAERCAACGDIDHVRRCGHDYALGLCLDCRQSARPPAWDEDLGGG